MLLTDIMNVFRQGQALTRAATWANAAAAGAALAGVLSGAVHIARAFGYELQGVTDDQIGAIAGGIAAAVGVASGLLGVAANPAAGLPPTGRTPDTGSAGDDANRDRF